MLNFNYNAELQHYSNKFNSNNIIIDMNNIENLEKNDEYLKLYLIKNNTDDYQFDIDKMYEDCYAYIHCYFYVFTQLYKSLKYEDLDKINFIKSGNSITYIHNM